MFPTRRHPFWVIVWHEAFELCCSNPDLFASYTYTDSQSNSYPAMENNATNEQVNATGGIAPGGGWKRDL